MEDYVTKALAVERDSFNCLPGPPEDIIKRGGNGESNVKNLILNPNVNSRDKILRKGPGLLGCGGFDAVKLWEHKHTIETYARKGSSKGYTVKTDMQESAHSETIGVIAERLHNMDPDFFEAKACELLHGLGLTKQMMNRCTKDMSAGRRIRVSFAQTQFVQPTLLLLEVPTNHLDLGASVWLEEHLKTYPNTLLLTSHSEDFMDDVCNHIMQLTQKGTLVTRLDVVVVAASAAYTPRKTYTPEVIGLGSNSLRLDAAAAAAAATTFGVLESPLPHLQKRENEGNAGGKKWKR